jgi:diadenylate cyclase
MGAYFNNILFMLSTTYFLWVRDVLDITLVSYCVYRLLLLIKGTRAVQLIKGLLILFVVYYIVNYYLQLRTMAFIMQYAATLVIIAIPIVFQPELRRLLAHIGQERILVESLFSRGKDLFDFINIMVLSVKNLSHKKTGALIIIERNTGLNEFVETGIKVDSALSPEVIETIFYSGTPLHDGAIVIKNNRIVAASVLLPLSENLNPVLGKYNLGTRHRAGLGLSETSDAICIIVSEETGDISVAIKGKLYRHLNEEGLEKLLLDTYQTKARNTINLSPVIKSNRISKLFNNDLRPGKKEVDENGRVIAGKKDVLSSYLQKNNLNLKITAVITAIIFMLLLGRAIPNEKYEMTFVLPVEAKSQDKKDNRKVQINPAEIKVKLSGNRQSLDNLGIEDLKASVNVEKADSNQRVPVNVSVPADVTIKEVNPKDVVININSR